MYNNMMTVKGEEEKQGENKGYIVSKIKKRFINEIRSFFFFLLRNFPRRKLKSMSQQTKCR
jgi:ribosomal protein L10